MHDPGRPALAGAALILALALGGCGESEPKPDPAALDRHFNKMIADDEAERRRLVEEARDREDVREREMEQRARDYNSAKD